MKKYRYTYKYTMYLPAGTFPMQQEAYKMPNAWIVDGVNCSVEAKRLWNILPPSIDAGWTHVGKIDKDKLVTSVAFVARCSISMQMARCI